MTHGGDGESLSPASLSPDYFDAVYDASDDPWRFETSAYEAAKYAETVAVLGVRRNERAFEIGCSIGVLTRQLAPLCARLLSVDVSDAALARARRRCADLPQVAFARLQVPEQYPEGDFDLVVMSEVGYYWSRADLQRGLDRIEASVRPAGRLLMVHWTPEVVDYPLRGDDVHVAALARAEGNSAAWRLLDGWRRESYRLDLLERR